MPRRSARRSITIDASIARASGHTDHPTSQRCRDCLDTIRDHGHRMVMTDQLREEWDRHQSAFALRWRASMQSRGRVIAIKAALDDDLRDRIEQTAASLAQQVAIAKDVHLVAAARATDRTILSLDEVMRRLLRRASGQVRELRLLVWANPDREADGVVAWLRAGAKPDAPRRLGAPQEP